MKNAEFRSLLEKIIKIFDEDKGAKISSQHRPNFAK